jgi:hypothetical protein
MKFKDLTIELQTKILQRKIRVIKEEKHKRLMDILENLYNSDRTYSQKYISKLKELK